MNEDKTIDWKAMIDKLSAYSGTIRDFCKENNIPEKQFYYHRRKLANKNKFVFHKIPLKSEGEEALETNKEELIWLLKGYEIRTKSKFKPVKEFAKKCYIYGRYKF